MPRIQSAVQVHIDLLNTVTDIGEIAKAASVFGYEMHLRPTPEGSEPWWEASLVRSEPNWLSRDLVYLVILQAMAEGESPRVVLDGVIEHLQQMHVPIEEPPGDVAGIGEMPPPDDQGR